MKHVHNLQKILHGVANGLMIVMLLCLIALPSASFDLINFDSDRDVLGTQDVRLLVDPQDIIDGKYIYDETTGKLIQNPRKMNNLPSYYLDRNSINEEPDVLGESDRRIKDLEEFDEYSYEEFEENEMRDKR